MSRAVTRVVARALWRASRRSPLRQGLGGLALALLAAHAAAAPSEADAAVQQARELARSNQPAQAIAAFERALAAAPERRGEWVLEFADQHTWAGRLDRAIALYREAIASPDADERRRARLGLARALSWDGRHARAVDQYQRVLADHPGDVEAWRGIGRAQSWRGRHRDAVERMQALRQLRPHDREATLVLVESLIWMGRSDRALAVLREQTAADAGDERATALRERLDAALRPHGAVGWRHFEQSDALRIDEWSAAVRFPLAGGRGQVGPRYSLARYVPPAGPVARIRVQRPGVEARWRLGDSLDWNGSLWLDVIDTDGAPGDHRLWTHDTYVTAWSSDVLRFDLGSSRWTFDSEETLRKGLTATQVKLSMDVLPDDLTRLTARVARADHSDGNRRDGWQVEAERRVWPEPRIQLGIRHNRYGFTTPGQPGYYNPARYRSNELTAQASGWMHGGIGWTLRAAFGEEDEQPGGPRPIRGGSASLTWEATPDLVLEAAYDYSTSRTLATGGFRRSIGRLTLRHRH
jgi:tetratricopeptide (TPR) repeat protein